MNMKKNNICEIDRCTGCGICAAACPSSAIRMLDDLEGFLYPYIIEAECSSCGRCIETCPSNKAIPENKDGPLAVFAGWHIDDAIRASSTSGGVFTAFAEEIIDREGSVVGAVYDKQLIVRHIAVTTKPDIALLRGSKYVQSELPLGMLFSVKKLLNEGRHVLFSGTPCQVAGVHAFLDREYESLFCCDLVCHGTPSPKLFAKYISILEQKKKAHIERYEFRSKKNGWKSLTIHVTYSNGNSTYIDPNSDPYFRSFLNNLSLRPSCYTCRYACIGREGDLTIGDFWGVQDRYPNFDTDDRGTSLILANTEKGESLLQSCKERLSLGVADLETATNGNQVLLRPVVRPDLRHSFFYELSRIGFKKLQKKYQLMPRLNLFGQIRSTRRAIKKMIKILVDKI
jgi:coenzyme F420-reducing hydrogenase beta subunit